MKNKLLKSIVATLLSASMLISFAACGEGDSESGATTGLNMNNSSTGEKIVPAPYSTVSAGSAHVVGLRNDGRVEAVGSNNEGQCDVEDWSDITMVSAGRNFTVGLKSDGTVLATGENGYGQCNVGDWNDIVAVAAGGGHTIGLKSDGTVVAVGLSNSGQTSVSHWSDIVAIYAGEYASFGIKSDGTVMSNQGVGSDWKDIVAVAAGEIYHFGLKKDGTVVKYESPNDMDLTDYGQCNVSDWTDIVAISAGRSHTVGLKSDGTVVAVGSNSDGKCNVQSFKDIGAICADENGTIVVKANGSVSHVGWVGSSSVTRLEWTNIANPRADKISSTTPMKGDYITFGKYEQDNDTSNGKEDISWRVLAIDGDKMLLISVYGLDAQPYNESSNEVTWESSTLRKWLNNDFYNMAFSEDEKGSILSTNVTAEDNTKYDTDAGNDTQDKVFLLSCNEAENYFDYGYSEVNEDERCCKPSEYVKAVSEYKYEDNENCRWWLRTPGETSEDASIVEEDGEINKFGEYVDSSFRMAVRPAMWVSIG